MTNELPELPPVTPGPLYQAVMIDGDCADEFFEYVQAYARAAVEQAKPAAAMELPESLVALARRCLHIAFVWNDHNFPAAHVMARNEAKEWGIHNFDDANEWLDVPGEWPVRVGKPTASAGVTEAMVEAAAAAIRQADYHTTPMEHCRKLARAALSAASPSAGVTEARLRDLVEAAQGFELVEHADETWLVFRSSVEKGLGAGSVRLDGPMAKDARARFALLRAALSAAKGEV